jgi:hypothetical protein
MLKKYALRAGIVATVLAGVAAFVPAGGSTVLMRAFNQARSGIDNNATLVAFSPATNPAFKVDGDTSCAAGRTGHLWTATTITATAVKNPSTTSVHVDLAGRTYVLNAPDFEATVSTSDSFACDALQGTALPYTATSWTGDTPQNGFGSSSTGLYTVTQID